MIRLNFKTGLCLLTNLIAIHTFAQPIKPPPPRRRPTPITRPRPLPPKPLALIYKGPGSCSLADDDAGTSGYSCSLASADVARAAGFQFKYVGPNDDPDFSKAKVWIQPGGIANVAFRAMSPELKQNLKDFIDDGGGYVGFCAGAFMATEKIGSTHEDGLGIFPGSSAPYDYDSVRDKAGDDVGYAFPLIKWGNRSRHVYFEGGPYFYDLDDDAQATGVFTDGAIVSARASFGKGRVYITGAHPEAPAIWSREDRLRDPDGSDLSLAVEMVRWSAKLIK